MFTAVQLFALFIFDSISHESTHVHSVKAPIPLYSKMQYAGNIGMGSIGLGTFLFHDKVSVDFSYGYLPASKQSQTVNTLALKPAYHVGSFKGTHLRWGLYSGICVTYSLTNNTYVSYPDHFPKGYYMSNAFHLNPFIGFKIMPRKSNRVNAHCFYTELGTVDYKLWYALSNKKVSALDIWNLCFGITLPLTK
jgi:hypothetical protein